MKLIFIIGMITVIFASLIGCGTDTGTIQASLDQEFTIPIDHTAIINQENLSIKFDKVTADSRCPKGAVCIWAGEARCQTYFSINNSAMAPVAVELVDQGGQIDGYSQTTWSSNAVTYKINFRLDPYPEAGKKTSNSDYRLIMLIAKAS